MTEPFPLQTPRLVIRRMRPADLEPLAAYRNDPVVWRYQGWNVPYTEADAQAFLAEMSTREIGVPGQWIQVAVALKEEDSIIGDVAFRVNRSRQAEAEIGVTLAQSYHGGGYAQEAILRLLEYLFETLQLHRVFALIDPTNVPSLRLVERLGFRREGHFIENYWDNHTNAWVDEYHYAMLQREWQNRE